MAVVVNRDDTTVEDPLEILMLFASDSDKLKGSDWVASSPYGAIIISCVYCIRAHNALAAGYKELAWSYMADARYWCGTSIASKGINSAYEQTVTETRSNAFGEALSVRAKSGSLGRNQAYKPLREYAYQLAHEKRPVGGWRSRSHAVRNIKNDVFNFSQKQGPKLKPDSLEKTVDKWLAEMPDTTNIFPNKNKKPS